MWKFYCGLVAVRPSFLHKTKGNTLFHIQCAYESQEKIACKHVLKAIEYHISLANITLTTPDFTAIGYISNTSVQQRPITLTLMQCNIDSDAVEAMLYDRSRLCIQSLHVEMDAIQIECMTRLLTCLSALTCLSIKAKAFEIHPRASQLTPNDHPRVLTKLVSHITSLSVIHVDLSQLLFLGDLPLRTVQTLNLVGTIVGFTEIKILAIALRSCQTLKELDVSSNNIGSEGASELASGLNSCSNLEKINISNNALTENSLQEILYSLRKNKLKVIAEELTIQKECVISSSDLLIGLEHCSNLQSLHISLLSADTDNFRSTCTGLTKMKELSIVLKTNYGNDETIDVLRGLKNFSELQTLTLKHGINSTHSSSELKNSLEHCRPSLKVLDLSDNKMDCNSIKHVATGLKNFKDLRELHLDNNRIGDNGARTLSLYLKYCHTLEKLTLSNNGISSSGCKVLAAHLHHCTKLQFST